MVKKFIKSSLKRLHFYLHLMKGLIHLIKNNNVQKKEKREINQETIPKRVQNVIRNAISKLFVISFIFYERMKNC